MGFLFGLLSCQSFPFGLFRGKAFGFRFFTRCPLLGEEAFLFGLLFCQSFFLPLFLRGKAFAFGLARYFAIVRCYSGGSFRTRNPGNLIYRSRQHDHNIIMLVSFHVLAVVFNLLVGHEVAFFHPSM